MKKQLCDLNIYLVGGAVRDMIMKIPSKDNDFVVVGSTPEEMMSMGFTQVGADFPVFLDFNNNEFALARTERKTGSGYHGFTTDFNSNVTIEQDLERRDLTINSIAMLPNTPDGEHQYIDPFNGIDDIKNKILRHTSEAFADDPVRVLRIARFAARFSDFTIASETMNLCKSLVMSGELNHLTAERVQLELMKVLSEKKPSRFFDVLNAFGALEVLFPEIHALIGQTQPEKWHAEGDAYVHTMMVVDHAATTSSEHAFYALVHDFGKGVTPKEKLPSHPGHEAAGVPITEAFCKRLKISSDMTRIAKKVTRYHGHVHKTNVMNPKIFVKMFDAEGGHNNFSDWYRVSQIARFDCMGRISDEGYDVNQYDVFDEKMKAINSVKLSKMFTVDEIKSMSVDKIKNVLHSERVRVLKNVS